MHVVDDLTWPIALASLIALAALVVGHVGHRLRVPAPALFLAFGIAANAAHGDARDSLIGIEPVVQVGSIALVLILFEGGFSGGFQRARASLGPIVSVGIAGTFLTAGLLATAAHVVLGLEWEVAAVLAVALAPTDPAAVFSILGNRDVRGRSSAVIEGESGINDPVGIALMVGVLELVDGHGSAAAVAGEFLLELLVGVVVGLAVGAIAGRVLGALRLAPSVMYPVAAVTVAFGTYAAAVSLHGSGFLAVLVAGLLLGDRLRDRRDIHGVVSLGSAVAEVAMFTLLGLTVSLSDLGGALGAGLVAFAILTFVIRPLVVAVTLAPCEFTRGERGFIAWGGLKGAVPVLLAAIAVIERAPDARLVYGYVFVAVAASILVQGATLPWLIERVGLVDEDDPGSGE